MRKSASPFVCFVGLLLATGCGNYRITFDLSKIINAGASDARREQLDVDIVCVTRRDAELLPGLNTGAITCAQWFKWRDENDQKIAHIPGSRIYSLRSGEPGLRDTLRGSPLLSPVDSRDGKSQVLVKDVYHPDFLNEESAIVIFGRFTMPENRENILPVVAKPPPGWLKDNNLVISVGRDRMVWTNRPR